MQLEEAQRRLPVTMQRMRRLIAIRASGKFSEPLHHNMITAGFRAQALHAWDALLWFTAGDLVGKWVGFTVCCHLHK